MLRANTWERLLLSSWVSLSMKLDCHRCCL